MKRRETVKAMAGLLAALSMPGGARAQALASPDGGGLRLSASLGADPRPLADGLVWRVFQERAEPDGSHALVAMTGDAAPTLAVPDGAYVVHVAYGLASAMKRVQVHGAFSDLRVSINAGGLRVSGMLGDAPIPPNRLRVDIYVPERSGAEARIVAADAKAGTEVRLPEGSYQIISTYLDKDNSGSTAPPGARPNDTNSVINAEVRVQAGKLTDVTVRHRAATMTLKLVNTPGGEAMANTSFSVLTPGGDVIRELIGAFPQVLLAEGEYAVIARRDGKTFQGTFSVQSTLDRDIEVLAK